MAAWPLCASGQLATTIIGNRHPGRRDARAGGHDIADHADLFRVQTAIGGDGDSGGRRLLIAGEQATFRQVQVNTGRADIVEGLDGSGQLAFHGALGIDVLDEAGLAETVLAVENLVADRSAAQRTVRGDAHAGFVNLVALDIDGRAAFADLIRNVCLVEQLRGRSRVGRVETGIEQGLAGAAHRTGKIHQRCGDTGGKAEDRGQPSGTESPELFKKRVHLEIPASLRALHQRSTGQNFPTCWVNETLRRLHTS